MKGKSGLLFAFILAALTIVAACDKGSRQPDQSKLGPSSAATSSVLPFGSPQCPIGGIRIDTGVDSNGNGVLDASEVVHAVPVCYDPGATGKSYGYNSLIKIESEPTGTLHCAAGGLKILSGIDTNRSNVLDSSEITYTEYVCNGAPGSGSAAGIMVAVAPPVVSSQKGTEKKNAKSSPSKTKQAASAAPGKTPGKARVNGKPQPAAEKQDAREEPASLPQKDKGSVKPSPAKTAKGAATTSAAPQGWTSVNVTSPQLAKVAYKIDGRYVIVRFTNLSKTSAVRFKYTVRWKEGQNASWVDDSTMEGISFRLKPLDALDREILTHAQEVKDVAVELDITEAAGAS
jgi:hypothetical protein